MSTFIPVVFYCFVPVEFIFLNFKPLFLVIYLGVAIIWIFIAFLCFNSGIKHYNSGSISGGRM